MFYIIIVGDHFAKFGENDNVFTFSKAVKILSANKYENDYQIIFGQGLSKENIEELKKLSCHDADKTLLFNRTPLLWETTHNVHKHKAENVLISETLKTGDVSYQCHLLIDDDDAEMSDHITGQHIQGMVLLEACRQMINSVSERFLIKSGSEKSFVLHEINSEFKEYLFPVDSVMEMTVRHFRSGLRGDFTAECMITVIQNNTLCLCVTIKFSAIDKEYLSLIEQQMATKSLSHLH